MDAEVISDPGLRSWIRMSGFPLLLACVLIALSIFPERAFSLAEEVSVEDLCLMMEEKYHGKVPLYWGEKVPGVLTRLDTDEPVLALTLDACGGKRGSGYDRDIIDLLRERRIPATLFINARWIAANPEVFEDLSGDPLFLIANHGMEHKPCSVSGMQAYGIQGTRSVREVVRKIELCGREIGSITGRKPEYYRSGTNFYDEISVKIASDLGYRVVGYSVPGDGGATFSREQMKSSILGSGNGDIILCHMNQPSSETFEGLAEIIPVLLERGFRFVHVSEYPLR